MNILNALKGISGEFEISRILGAAGVGTYIIAGPTFEAIEVLRTGHFDVVAFCTAYPAGLAAALGAAAGSIALKDRNVAVARQTQDNPPPAVPAPVTKVAGDLNTENVENVEMSHRGDKP